MRDQVYVAPVKYRVLLRLLTRWNETLAKDHVSRIEPAGIGPAEEHSIAIHFGIDQISTRLLHELFPQVLVVAELSIGRLEWRREHVMPEVIPKIMAALFVILPVRQDRVRRHDRNNREQRSERKLLAPDPNHGNKRQRQRQTEISRVAHDWIGSRSNRIEHAIKCGCRRRNAAIESPLAPLGILCRQQRTNQRQSISESDGNQDVRGDEERLIEIPTLAVRCRV